ncbi:MAG TPA: hypothetical protein VGG77_02870 [Roseiarcus sp.]
MEVRTAGFSGPEESDADAIEEWAGLAADCVPACYLEAWARLNYQRPFAVSARRLAARPK